MGREDLQRETRSQKALLSPSTPAYIYTQHRDSLALGSAAGDPPLASRKRAPTKAQNSPGRLGRFRPRRTSRSPAAVKTSPPPLAFFSFAVLSFAPSACEHTCGAHSALAPRARCLVAAVTMFAPFKSEADRKGPSPIPESIQALFSFSAAP